MVMDSTIETINESEAFPILEFSNQDLILKNSESCQRDFINDLRKWAVSQKVPHSTLKILLEILNHHKKHPNLPKDPRCLLKTPRDRKEIIPLGSGSYVHYGLERVLKDELDLFEDNMFIPSSIFIDVNIDGLPLANSSKSSVWPILGRIVLDSVDTEPFFIAAYHGLTKIEDVNEYLKIFVEELIKLGSEGFSHNGRVYFVFLRNILCDTPARCFVLVCPHYLSYESCPRCDIYGEWDGQLLFIGTNFSLRDDSSYRSSLPEPFNYILSPFESIPGFRPVSQVPLDPMHLLYQGEVKKLFQIWATESKSADVLKKIEKLNNKLLDLNPYVPMEFARKFRIIDYYAFEKATEFRKKLLYAAPVAFDDFLSPDRLTHFVSLHCAARILSDPEFCISLNKYADDLLKWVSNNMGNLYGKSKNVPNNHYLSHLAAEVLIHGSLDSFGAFIFECFLFQIKQLVRNGLIPLSQIFNRVCEIKTAGVRSYKAKLQKNEYMTGTEKAVDQKFIGRFSKSYTSVRFCNFTLSDKLPDNCCYLLDNTVFWIELISELPSGEIVFVGKKFDSYDSIPSYPFDSKIIHCYVVKHLENVENFIKINEIKRKAFLMPYKNDTFIVQPLLHSSN